jgi:hypothetical protein
MQKAITNIIKYLPNIALSVGLIFAQLLFINVNIIGVYLFGRLFTSSEKFKLLPAIVVITLIYDSAKIIPFGSWALSFSVVALAVEAITTIFHAREEIGKPTLRGEVLLALCTALAAGGQAALVRTIAGESVALIDEYSIVVLTLIYVLIYKITASRRRQDYLHI